MVAVRARVSGSRSTSLTGDRTHDRRAASCIGDRPGARMTGLIDHCWRIQNEPALFQVRVKVLGERALDPYCSRARTPRLARIVQVRAVYRRGAHRPVTITRKSTVGKTCIWRKRRKRPSGYDFEEMGRAPGGTAGQAWIPIRLS